MHLSPFSCRLNCDAKNVLWKAWICELREYDVQKDEADQLRLSAITKMKRFGQTRDDLPGGSEFSRL